MVEMSTDQLWPTTLAVERRRLRQVTMADAAAASAMFDLCMGDDAAARSDYSITSAPELDSALWTPDIPVGPVLHRPRRFATRHPPVAKFTAVRSAGNGEVCVYTNLRRTSAGSGPRHVQHRVPLTGPRRRHAHLADNRVA